MPAKAPKVSIRSPKGKGTNRVQVEIIGIRHHGPASARCVRQVLQKHKPDCILVEGPPEANDMIGWVGNKQLQPPVALLVYREQAPSEAAFFPMVEYSPEWQALLYANKVKVTARFIDLPQRYQLGTGPEEETADSQESATTQATTRESTDDVEKAAAFDQTGEESDGDFQIHSEGTDQDETSLWSDETDPFRLLARAAGYTDPEGWWDTLIEHRRSLEELPTAILELMAALREEVEKEIPSDALTLVREAYMRQQIRQARQDGFTKIAVVCGAWHAPALLRWANSAESDEHLVQNYLQRCGRNHPDVVVTWIPWSYQRLSTTSGYRSGVVSPAWYEYLWQQEDHQLIAQWMTRAARLLRDEGVEIGPAHAIEATRLASSLAALRGHAIPDLNDLEHAMQAVYCYRDDRPLQLIRQRLIIGERTGKVPAALTSTSLHRDIVRTCHELHLDPSTLCPVRSSAEQRHVDLDLRQKLNQQRSIFYHRLRLLGFDLEPEEKSGARGTFHEVWDLRGWGPEAVLQLVEKSVHGNDLVQATSRYVCHSLPEANLQRSAELIEALLFADLPFVLGEVLQHVQELAAHSTDVIDLLQSWPSFAQQLRYGNVRQSDKSMLARIVHDIFVRLCLHIPQACALVKEEVAVELGQLLIRLHQQVDVLAEPMQQQWWYLLQQLADTAGHGYLQGLITRLLYDAHQEDKSALLIRFQRLLSPGMSAEQAIAWLQGFLYSGLTILLHVDELRHLLDAWLIELPEEVFIAHLPLLRRAFVTPHDAVRRQLLQLLALPQASRSMDSRTDEKLDVRRAELACTWVRMLAQWEQETTS
ncbi:MAG: DUF5682 family protein [Gemmataceae bacterium]|nr:DUF5682 family protein [Gemmataceae bacterium]